MKRGKFLLGVFLTLLFTGGWLFWDYYGRFFNPNVELKDSSIEFYINSSDDFQDLIKSLANESIIKDSSSFRWVANYKNYTGSIKAGRYQIFDGMSNNQLVNLLRSGEQDPVRLIIRSVRTKEELASIVGKHLETDSADLMSLLNNEGYCQRYGFNSTSIFTLFIPNTYEFYWNTTAEEFMTRMAKEYKRFWTDVRVDQAKRIGLTQSQVSTLASIVQAEQGAHPDERPIVAGLYLNRLKKGMRLESDPTLIFALGDFTIKRVLNVHKEVDSPYNTYRNAGLPPGPIFLPEISSIDAVLKPTQSNYIFMCAKEDFSGYHNFASSYREHQNNAIRYQRKLNAQKIYK